MDDRFLTNYIISRDGIIKNAATGKTIKPYKMANGYLQVTLYDYNGHHKKFLVHRLVASQYIPNPKNCSTVNHKNLVKSDNRVENLEWLSLADNLRHARKYGRDIYTKERNKKISDAKRGVPRSEETREKMSAYMKNLSQEKKMAMIHHLHKNRPSMTCPLCLANDKDLPRINQ